MGANYSVGPLPPFLERYLKKHDVVAIRSRKYRFEYFNRPKAFLTSSEIRVALELQDADVFRLIRLLDHNGNGQINSVEMWAALALAAGNEPPEKCSFCFELFDFNGDKFMSLADVYVLIRCATLGLSSIKGIKTPDNKQLSKFVSNLSQSKGVQLNEKGEVSMNDFRAYLLSADISRAYLTSLGTVAVVVDKVKMVAQRGETIRSIAEIDAEIRVLELQVQESAEDEAIYHLERGGDIELLRIKDRDLDATGIKSAPGTPAKRSTASQQQQQQALHQNRSSAAVTHKPVKEPDLEDARIFSVGTNRDTTINANAEYKNVVWKKQYVDDDGLAEMNPALLVEVFESANLNIELHEAAKCLAEVPANQLGRHRLNDLLAWHHRYSDQKAGLYQGAWSDFCQSLYARGEAVRAARDYVYQVLNKQDEIQRLSQRSTDGDSKAATTAEQMSFTAWQRQRMPIPSAKAAVKMRFNQPTDEVSVAMRSVTEANRVKDGITPAAAAGFHAKLTCRATLTADLSSAANLTAFSRVTANAVLNNIRDKQRGNDPFLCCGWLGIWLKRGITSTELEIVKTTVKNFFLVHKTLSWGLYDVVEVHVVIPDAPLATTTAETAEDNTANNHTDDNTSISSIDNSNYQKQLIVYLMRREDLVKELEANLPKTFYMTRAMRSLDVDLQFNETLQELYEKATKYLNFERKVYGPQEEELGEDGMNPIKFAKVCKQRKDAALLAAKTSMKMSKADLIEHCRSRGYSIEGTIEQLAARVTKIFEKQAKLIGFGEISDFGRRLVERIISIVKPKLTQLQMQQEQRERDQSPPKKGTSTVASNSGTKSVTSVASAITKKTTTGSTITNSTATKKKSTNSNASIASKATKNSTSTEAVPVVSENLLEDVGVNLWELNSLLYLLGSQTIFDNEDYKSILIDEDMLTDPEGNLSTEGFFHYYERHGRLTLDAQKLGIGGLNDLVTGELQMQLTYDAEAVASLLHMLEPQGNTLSGLAKAVIALASNGDSSCEFSCPRLSDVIHKLLAFFGASGEDLSAIRRLFDTPGWPAQIGLSLVDALASGDEGVLVALRHQLQQQFGKFYTWEDLYLEVIRGEETFIPTAANDDDEEDGAPESYIDMKLKEILPEVIDIGPATKRLQLLEGHMNFLQTLAVGETIRLSRSDREAMREIMIKIREELEELKEARTKFMELIPAHVCAMYDAMKLYCSGIAGVGFGSREITASLLVDGLDFCDSLPRGIGEKSEYAEQLEEKIKKAQKRKEAAAAAMRRQRRKGVVVLEEEVAPPPPMVIATKSPDELADEQITLLFTELSHDYNTTKSKSAGRAPPGSKLGVVRKWEAVLLLLRDYKTDTLKHALGLNNTSCAIARYYETSHSKQKNTLIHMQRAIRIMVYLGMAQNPEKSADNHIRDQDVVFDAKGNFHEHAVDFLSDIPESSNLWTPFANMLLNYLVIMKINRVGYYPATIQFLEQVFTRAEFSDSMYDELKLCGFPLFGASETMPDLDDLVSAHSVDPSALDDGTATLAGSQITSKFSKKSGLSGPTSEKPSEAVKNEAIRKRRELYELIQSGEISTLFEAASKAGNDTSSIEKFL